MKTCIFSESSADEAGVRIFVDALLGRPTSPVATPPLRTRGWTQMLAVVPVVVKHLHYHTDAEALVIVLDSDFSPIHEPTHDGKEVQNAACRLCAMRTAVARVRTILRSRADRPAPLKIAVGLAVPAIEAWYLVGADPHVSEATWIMGVRAKSFPYTRSQLKQKVYGTERLTLAEETAGAIREARRVAADLARIEASFPNGFGALARDVRAW